MNKSSHKNKKHNKSKPKLTQVVRLLEKKSKPRRKRQQSQSLTNHVSKFVGSGLKKLAMAGIGAVTGFGAYKIKSNSLSGGPPSFGSGNCRIRHREYVADVVGTTAFTLTSYQINPGNGTLFPWFSRCASNYEEYDIKGMLVEFRSTSSESVVSTGGNAALGTVVMSTQYNNDDPAFPDKRSMENSEFATSSPPSQSFIHPIECARNSLITPRLYIRQPGATVTDVNFYDHGIVSLATVGQQANVGVIGELWVSYDIELSKPRTTAYSPTVSAHYRLTGATISGSTYVPYCNTSVVESFDTIGATLAYLSSTYGATLTFTRPGSYLVVLSCCLTTIINPSPNTVLSPAALIASYVGGSSLSGIWFNYTGTGNNPSCYSVASGDGYIGSTAAPGYVQTSFILNVPTVGAGVTLNPLISTTAAVGAITIYSDLVITEINSTVTLSREPSLKDLQAEIEKLTTLMRPRFEDDCVSVTPVDRHSFNLKPLNLPTTR